MLLGNLSSKQRIRCWKTKKLTLWITRITTSWSFNSTKWHRIWINWMVNIDPIWIWIMLASKMAKNSIDWKKRTKNWKVKLMILRIWRKILKSKSCYRIKHNLTFLKQRKIGNWLWKQWKERKGLAICGIEAIFKSLIKKKNV